MTAHVYKITHFDSGRVYVGLTVDPRKRWALHVNEARRTTPTRFSVTRAMREHGVDRFNFEVIETVETHTLGVEREIYWIAKIRETNPGGIYNINPGGDGAGSDEARARLSQALRGKKHSAEHIAKNRASHLGKKNSAETRAKLSALRRGKPWTDERRAARRGKPWTDKRRAAGISAEHQAKMIAARRGKPLSAEHRAKIAAAHLGKKRPQISAALRGRPCSEETRAKISAANRGKPRPKTIAALRGKKLSAEHRAKIAAGYRAYWAQERTDEQREQLVAKRIASNRARRLPDHLISKKSLRRRQRQDRLREVIISSAPVERPL